MKPLTITVFCERLLNGALPPRGEALLLLILLSPADQLSQQQVTELLWPELTADRRKVPLRRRLTEIERASAALQPARPLLISSSRGVLQINRSGLTVDLLALEAAFAAVDQHAHTELNSCQLCLERLEQALRALPAVLYRPQPRQPEPFHRWWHERTAATLVRLQAAYRSVHTARLQQQQYAAAEALAERWVAQFPDDEAALRALITTIALSGRPEQALEVFGRRSTRGGPEAPLERATSALIERIRRSSSGLSDAAAGPPELFGRDQLCADIEHQLSGEARLVVLVGLAGVGKSSIAAQIAARSLLRFSDGADIIRLSPAADRAALCNALAEQVSLTLHGEAPSIELIAARLAEADRLLVIDNVEQIGDVEELLYSLLSRTQRLRLLITSRRLLQLQQAVTRMIEPLPVGLQGDDWRSNPALRLLLSHSGRRTADVPDSDRRALQTLLQLCGGLPLALELTGRLIATQSFPRVIGQIRSSRAEPLSADPAGQLRAILGSTWRILPAAADRQVISAIGAFHGPFDASLLRAVAAPFAAAAVVDRTVRLAIDYALLQIDAAGRYQRHPLLQQLLAEELSARPALEPVVREAHARAYLGLLIRSGPKVVNRTTLDWCRVHAELADDLLAAWRAAVSFRLDDLLIAAVLPLLLFAGNRSLNRRFDAQLQQDLATVAASNLQLRCELLTARLQLFMFHGDYIRLQPVIDELITDATLPGAVQALGLRFAAEQAADHGDLAAARQFIDRALSLGPPDGSLQRTIARWHRRRGEAEQARPLFYAALAESRRKGDQRGELSILNELALVQIMQGEVSSALGPLQEAVVLARNLGDEHVLATLLTNLAHARQETGGDLDQSLRELEEAVTLARSYRLDRNLRFAVATLGHACYRRGRYHRAYEALRETLLTDCRAGFVPWTPDQLLCYLDTLRALGRHERQAELAAALHSLPTDDADLQQRRAALLAELPAFSALDGPISPAALQALISADDDLLNGQPRRE